MRTGTGLINDCSNRNRSDANLFGAGLRRTVRTSTYYGTHYRRTLTRVSIPHLAATSGTFQLGGRCALSYTAAHEASEPEHKSEVSKAIVQHLELIQIQSVQHVDALHTGGFPEHDRQWMEDRIADLIRACTNREIVVDIALNS